LLKNGLVGVCFCFVKGGVGEKKMLTYCDVFSKAKSRKICCPKGCNESERYSPYSH
jgi:hypothetical protein